jgi:hypothetical protein
MAFETFEKYQKAVQIRTFRLFGRTVRNNAVCSTHLPSGDCLVVQNDSDCRDIGRQT